MIELDHAIVPRSGGITGLAYHSIEQGSLRWAGRAIGKAALVAGAVMAFGVGGAAGESRRVVVPGLDAAVVSDSFAHVQHTKLPCMTCHLSSSGAMLTFTPPRGCQICHHVDQARNGCAQCHSPGSVPEAIEVRLAIASADTPARERTVAFRHEGHASQKCAACHGQSVTLAPVDSALTCRGCHADHHQARRNCATCHRTESITQPHSRPVQAHVACDRCHSTAAIAPLTPTRSFCLVCHEPSVDHYPEHECTACHLQASPEEYRPHLLR
jgi:hypothetical protein